jgi:hypothetical protein
VADDDGTDRAADQEPTGQQQDSAPRHGRKAMNTAVAAKEMAPSNTFLMAFAGGIRESTSSRSTASNITPEPAPK